MIKKVLIGGGAAFLLGTLVFGTGLLSYVSTSMHNVRESVKSNVPVKFELDRARQMVQEMEPEVRHAMHTIAKQEVDVEKLHKQVADLESRLAKEESELKRLHTDAQVGYATYEYGGKKYSLDQVKTDLGHRLKNLKTGEQTLDTQRKILAAREKGLEAAQRRLKEMLAARQELKAEIEGLEARQEMIAAAQTANEYNFDAGQLGRVRELVSDLRTRLEVDEKLVNSEGFYDGRIPLEEPSTADVMDQVSEHFAGKESVAKAEGQLQVDLQSVAKAGK